MTAPTHLAFGVLNGIVLLSLTTTIGEQPMRPDAATALNAIAVLIGSLAPDLDSPGSAVSRAFPLSRLIHRRWAHRSLWHSILGLLLATLSVYLGLSVLIAVLPHTAAPGTVAGFFATAYASHLIADCLTVRGVPFLYPFQPHFGYPTPEHYRLRTGNRKHELVFSGVCLAAALLYLPVVRAGGARASLHQALGSFSAAFDDYRSLAGQEAVLAFSGSYSGTREPVEGQGPILEASPQRFLVYFGGMVVEVGDTKGDIMVTAARCIPTGRPVSVESITISSEPWVAVLERIPANALASGELSASHPFTTGRSGLAAAKAATVTSQVLRLAYAQLPELARLQPAPRTKEEELAAERVALNRSLQGLRQSTADTVAARNARKDPYERERLFGALKALRTKQTSLERQLERVEQDLAAARAVQLRFSGVLLLRTPFVN